MKINFLAFYLKYRPQLISELDSTKVRENLEKILSSKDFPHAFLFSGPKGLGKTSSARIVAKAINCKEKKSIEPCNRCEDCLSITNGTSLDVIEIDGASNRGIDDVRSLRETIKLSPSQLKYKVYVIDEVHMLTTEAFNALLKTLEEPPKHAVFILATTEPHKVPATIISRTIQIKFFKANSEETIRSLTRIVKAEGLEISNESLDLIAKISEGSFRDATKILEQVSFNGNKITPKDIQILTGSEFNFDLWLTTLALQNTKKALELSQKAIAEGVDLKWLLGQTLESLKEMLLKNKGIEVSGKYPDLAMPQILKLSKLLITAYGDIKICPVPELALQVAIVNWGEENNNPEKETKKEMKEEPVKNLKIPKNTNFKTTLDDVIKKWDIFLRSMRPHNNSIEALLRSTRPLKLENGTLTIEVFYKFHKERLESGKCPQILEKVLVDLFGENIKVNCNLGKRTVIPVNIPKQENVDLSVAEEIFLKDN